MSAQVTRRTIAKGAAWSVPVVALAGAAPAASASTACTLGLSINMFREEDRGNYASVIPELIITAGDCSTGVPLNAPLQVKFTLDAPYRSWNSADLVPSAGNGTGSFTAQTARTFQGAGDWGRIVIAVGKSSESATPITFTISAPGLATTTFTANPI